MIWGVEEREGRRRGGRERGWEEGAFKLGHWPRRYWKAFVTHWLYTAGFLAFGTWRFFQFSHFLVNDWSPPPIALATPRPSTSLNSEFFLISLSSCQYIRQSFFPSPHCVYLIFSMKNTLSMVPIGPPVPIQGGVVLVPDTRVISGSLKGTPLWKPHLRPLYDALS